MQATSDRAGTPSIPDDVHKSTALPAPQCSIIVPVYEHWHLVPTLLQHLANQTYPGDRFEVLLIDNGSAAFEPPPCLPSNVRIAQCLTPGSYAARNHGVEQALGQWLVFTDADCRPNPEWLATLMAPAAAHEAEANTIQAGAIRMVAQSSRPTAWEIYDLIRGIPQDWYVARGYATTANLAVHRDCFDRIGRFDGTRLSGGDAEFCRRAIAAGASLRYVPEATVAHPARQSWPEIARKVRRIKGAQILAGSRRQRATALARTFSPPLIGLARFAMRRDMPIHYRLLAGLVQFRVWGLEIRETVRLLAAGNAERR